MTAVPRHEPRNVLITGGCGFIGSNFLNYIYHKKWPNAKIVNLDKLILNSDCNNVPEEVRGSERYELVLSDIRNKEVVGRVLREHQIDTVVHFAADCTSTRCYNDPHEALENNVLAFLELLEAVREYGAVQKFVHISTDEVYGDSEFGADAQPKQEVQSLLPGNPYAATKAACEAYVHLYQHIYNLPIVTLRVNNIYGPNQWNVKLIPRFIEVARNGERFPVQGNGEQLRSWLFVDDASEGICKAIEQGQIGQIYNLGTYFELNVNQVAKYVQAEIDRQLDRPAKLVEFDYITDRPYNDQRYLIDISKAKTELGWEPEVPFEEGLKRTVRAYLRNNNEYPQRMSVVIYGGRGWVGLQVQKLLRQRKIPFHLAKYKLGIDDEAKIIDELNQLCGTHVLCCTGRTHGGQFKTIEYLEGGSDRDYENVRDNLFCPLALAEYCKGIGLHYTYIGTGYLFAYDNGPHTVGGQPFSETDLPTFFGNSYSVVKGFTDRMANRLSYAESINARITLPLNYELNEDRNLLSKIITYKQIFDCPVSITILPECLPALFHLMEQRYSGPLNLVNSGPISLHEILQLYKKYYDENLSEYEAFGIDSEKGKQLMATKGNCALSTELLCRLCPDIKTSETSLMENLRKMKLSKS